MKAGFKATLTVLDKTKAKRILEKRLKEELEIAVRNFLRAVLPKIPVRTGFLKGSFAKVLSRFKILSVPGGKPVPSTKRQEYYYLSKDNKILKTPTSGIPFSIKPAEVLRISGLRFTFRFESEIIYYRVNDLNKRGKGTPWRSVNAGLAEFKKKLQQIRKTLLTIKEISGEMTIISKDGRTSKTTNFKV